jgi:hypothetical protein
MKFEAEVWSSRPDSSIWVWSPEFKAGVWIQDRSLELEAIL